MARWEYAVLYAIYRGEVWDLTLRVPGYPDRRWSEPWVSWVGVQANELGQDGWELVDRSAVGTSQEAVVNWHFIFKRPMPWTP